MQEKVAWKVFYEKAFLNITQSRRKIPVLESASNAVKNLQAIRPSGLQLY